MLPLGRFKRTEKRPGMLKDRSCRRGAGSVAGLGTPSKRCDHRGNSHALEYVLQPISVFRTILQMAVEPFLQSCCGGRDLLSAEVVRPVLFGRPEQHIGRGYGNMVAVNTIQRRCQAGQHERGMRIVVAAWNDRHNFSACYQLPKTITALVPGARFKDADPGVAKIPESFYLHVMKLH